MSAALSIEGVSKRFNRDAHKRGAIKELIAHPADYFRGDRFWALEDVNLEIGVGETVGLIGANGSGKSTLLRLIGGLGRPTRGRIVRYRRVDAMLSLGDGLTPLLTGRENAITAGILAGFRRSEIVARLPEIVAFAELEESFDRPLRTYSDGMRLRLAFSVAISTNPEILLIDEVLAVGDLRFQQKCFDRLTELQEQGTTIMLASHDDDQVQRLCGRVLWLARGRTQALGSTEDVLEAYRGAMQVETERRVQLARQTAEHGDLEGATRSGTLEVEITAVRITPPEVRVGGAGPARPVVVEIDLLPHEPVEEPILSISLHRVRDMTKVMDVSSDGDGVRLGRLDAPRTVILTLDRLDVEAGSYRLDVGVYARDWSYVYDYHWHAYPLEIVGARGFGPSRRWSGSA
jgi:lipopolysaccharide transport system ATP-binding protein